MARGGAHAEASAARRPHLRGIYGIVDAQASADPESFARALLAGGIRLLQYRAKGGVDRAFVRAVCRRAHAVGAWVIVNDDFEAALESDGWHAGQEDLAGRDVRALRAALGTRLFGVSCGTAELARAAEAAGANYVGVGPFAKSSTKIGERHPLGEGGLRAVVAAVRIPVVAIGGIGPENLAPVRRTGAAMAAVISALAGATDPQAAAADLIERWEAGTR